jgi:hypothetical protein
MTQRPVLNKNRSVVLSQKCDYQIFSEDEKNVVSSRSNFEGHPGDFDVEKKMQLLNSFISENTNFYDWVCNKNQVKLCQ